jgi:hypothetical protein
MFLCLPIWADTTVLDVDYEDLHAHDRMTGLYSTTNTRRSHWQLAGPMLGRGRGTNVVISADVVDQDQYCVPELAPDQAVGVIRRSSSSSSSPPRSLCFFLATSYTPIVAPPYCRLARSTRPVEASWTRSRSRPFCRCSNFEESSSLQVSHCRFS